MGQLKKKKNLYNLQIDVIQPEKHTHNNNPNKTTNIMIQDNVCAYTHLKNEKKKRMKNMSVVIK